MTPPFAPAPVIRFPADPPRQPETLLSGVRTLRNWRDGSAASAIAMTALLPFAIAWQVRYLVAIVGPIIASAVIVLATHLSCESRLRILAIHPQFGHLPELAQERRRLLDDRKRRGLANGLRRTADPTQSPARFDSCPILRDRVAAVRLELLQIATALEQATDPAPTCIALIRGLLTNACSPLYNDNVPTADLHTTLRRAAAGLLSAPLTQAAAREPLQVNCPALMETRTSGFTLRGRTRS